MSGAHPVPSPPREALVVSHADVAVEDLVTLLTRLDLERSVIASSHQMYPNEIETLVRTHPHAEVVTFAELLDDASMAGIDTQATESLEQGRRDAGWRMRYPGRYAECMTHFKNERLGGLLRRRFGDLPIYFEPGLGVDESYWRSRGGHRFRPNAVEPSPPPDLTSKRFGRLRRVAGSPPSVVVVRGREQTTVFPTRVDRLEFAPDVLVERRRLSRAYNVVGEFAPDRAPSAFRRLAAWAAGRGRPVEFATTIHQYSRATEILFAPYAVYIDGFHPPNYPRSYIDLFDPSLEFIVREPFSEQWFRRHGYRTRKDRELLSSACMEPVQPSCPALAVLGLNHAGDWSALINRSDTERLVTAFAELAAAQPQLTCIIRPHPTAALPPHEGERALDRMAEFIAWRSLPNLSLSMADLATDLSRGDLFISEYSQVLIDAVRRGKFGVIANLTGRRSFMECYEELGLPSVDTSDELVERVGAIRANPGAAAQVQNQVVNRFNELLAAEGFRSS